MSVWHLLFPSKEAREQRAQEEREIQQLTQKRVNTRQAALSGSHVMKTYASAMQMMARGENEDR